MKDFFFLIVGIAVIVGSFYLFLQQPAPEKYQDPSQPSPWQGREDPDSPPAKGELEGVIKIGDVTIPVEIADTDEERNLGLSGRASLAEGTGLLFIFEKADKHGFWMKDMNFAIDIVWIDESWQVAGVEREVGPKTFPKVFYPNRAIKYVLELPSGNAAKFGIDTGVRLSSDQ